MAALVRFRFLFRLAVRSCFRISSLTGMAWRSVLDRDQIAVSQAGGSALALTTFRRRRDGRHIVVRDDFPTAGVEHGRTLIDGPFQHGSGFDRFAMEKTWLGNKEFHGGMD